MRRQVGELKHLSSRKKRNRRDSLSSGERTGTSLNLYRVKPAGVAIEGLWDLMEGAAALQGVTKFVLSKSAWNGTP